MLDGIGQDNGPALKGVKVVLCFVVAIIRLAGRELPGHVGRELGTERVTGFGTALAEMQPALVVVAEEKGAGQLSVMPSQGQKA